MKFLNMLIALVLDEFKSEFPGEVDVFITC